MRLDVFLSDSTGVSRRQVQRRILAGQVRVNDRVATKSGYRCRSSEAISWTDPEPEASELLAQDLPLSVVYEDGDLIVIDKPAGMVVHPAAGNPDGTLVNALLHHCDDLRGVGGELRPGIVHRIDKDTSGLLVAAKNDAAHHFLAAQFEAHSVERLYRALVFGRPEPEAGILTGNLARHPRDRKRYAVAEGRGRHAVTHYRLLSDYGELSFLELKLETGRTHQIRVHLSHIGHPIVGDGVYGRSRRVAHLKDKPLIDRLRGVARQMLHAATLGFQHPDGRRLFFESPPPGDMTELLAWLDRRSETS